MFLYLYIAGGGTYASGYCPNDPATVKCCYKSACSSGGSCKWSNQCSGSTASGFCPGPSDFKCCLPATTGVTTSSNKLAVASYADSHWNCANPTCSGAKTVVGNAQPDFQCAEFVSRALAAGGFISGLNADSSASSYGSYSYGNVIYNLRWTSSKYQGTKGLEDFLKATGWTSVASISANVHAATVVFTTNGNGQAYGHVVVGVGENLIDAHNMARFHVNLGFYTVNAIYTK